VEHSTERFLHDVAPRVAQWLTPKFKA
jgi:hypothetical protein